MGSDPLYNPNYQGFVTQARKLSQSYLGWTLLRYQATFCEHKKSIPKTPFYLSISRGFLDLWPKNISIQNLFSFVFLKNLFDLRVFSTQHGWKDSIRSPFPWFFPRWSSREGGWPMGLTVDCRPSGHASPWPRGLGQWFHCLADFRWCHVEKSAGFPFRETWAQLTIKVFFQRMMFKDGRGQCLLSLEKTWSDRSWQFYFNFKITLTMAFVHWSAGVKLPKLLKHILIKLDHLHNSRGERNKYRNPHLQ